MLNETKGIHKTTVEGNTVLAMFSGDSPYQTALQLGDRCIQEIAATLARKNRF